MFSVIRVLIVDDSDIVRRGLTEIIDADEDFQVVGSAADGRDALAVAARLKPDLILMDIRLSPGFDGIDATGELTAAEDPPRVIILTVFGDDEYVQRAVDAGAAGFMLKDLPPDQLLLGLRAAAAGQAVLDPAVTRKVMEELATLRSGVSEVDEEKLASLTEREREVLGLIGRGLSNADIGGQLFMTEGTVKGYVSAILTKLGVENRVQAARIAFRAGLDR